MRLEGGKIRGRHYRNVLSGASFLYDNGGAAREGALTIAEKWSVVLG